MLMRLFHGYSFEHVDKGASKKQFNARASVKKFKRRSDAQQEAAVSEPGHANCGQLRNAADRRDFCAVRDSEHVVLATDQHELGYAQPQLVLVAEHALARSVGAHVTRRAMLHQDGYSHCDPWHWWYTALSRDIERRSLWESGRPHPAQRASLAQPDTG